VGTIVHIQISVTNSDVYPHMSQTQIQSHISVTNSDGYLDVDDGSSISFLKSRISDHIWMWTWEMEQREGGVGYFSNERGFSVECSLQHAFRRIVCRGNETLRE